MTSFAVTGIGTCLGTSNGVVDATPFLRQPKNRKFMGVQDHLAVAAAATAVRQAGLSAEILAERTGIFLATGYIPFAQEDLDVLGEFSTDAGALSMSRFASDALPRLNPLLTFRCLPNMPLFHVSLNLGIRGPTYTTYPGRGQLIMALDQACAALADGVVDAALVGGVADQDNALVRHHHRRRDRAWNGVNAAGVLVLERTQDARARDAPVQAELESCTITYRPADPFASDSDREDPLPADDTGAASPIFHLARALAAGPGGPQTYHLRSADGITATLRWHLPAVVSW